MTYRYTVEDYKVDPWTMPDHIKEEFNRPVNVPENKEYVPDSEEDTLKRVEENREDWNPGGYSTKGGFSRLTQVGGDHYKKYEVQPWDIIEMYDLDFFEGNALKYLLRHKTDRLEDLKKCRHYLDKAIERKETVE